LKNLKFFLSVASIVIFFLISFFFIQLFLRERPPRLPEKSDKKGCDFQSVSRVIDGDTFDTGRGQRIRLIGVDTPEISDPRKPVEWFAREASKKLKEWIDGEPVCLKKDIDKTRDTDKYGRLLSYVWKYDDNETNTFFVNAEIIKQGYGFAYTRFPFQYLDDFRELERQARENNRGLWNREKQEQWEQDVKKNRAFAGTCGEDSTICPEDAQYNMGKQKTVRFFVEKSFDSGKAVFLNSKNNYKDPRNFTAVIFQTDRQRFPPSPEDAYWGKTIDVSGRIKKYKGRAEIILQNISQITINQ
jgi:endonuclease YncB( thermonuclease family)